MGAWRKKESRANVHQSTVRAVHAFCLLVAHFVRGEGKSEKRVYRVSDGVELRSFEIRRTTLRDGNTRAVVPCFRTARHSARLDRGGLRVHRDMRRGVPSKSAEERRGGPRSAHEVRRSKRRRKNSARPRDTTSPFVSIVMRRKWIFTLAFPEVPVQHATVADRRLLGNGS